jgi:hypothetical protein
MVFVLLFRVDKVSNIITGNHEPVVLGVCCPELINICLSGDQVAASGPVQSVIPTDSVGVFRETPFLF